MRNRRFSSRPRLAVEGLEARDVPAGSVSVAVSGSVITLTGDDQNNSIDMHKDATGKVVITGTLGTEITTNAASGTVVGSVFTSTSVDIKTVRATMKGGDDSIANDLSAADFAFSGGFTYDAGDGNNSLNLTDNSSKIILGSLTFKALDGQDGVTLDSGVGPTSGSSFGAVNISLGDGGSFFGDSFVNLSNAEVKSVTITAGEGNEDISMLSLQGILSVLPPVKVTGGHGSTNVYAADSLFGAVNVSSLGNSGLTIENTPAGTAMTSGKITVSGGKVDNGFFQTFSTPALLVTVADVSVKGGYVGTTVSEGTTTGAFKLAALGSIFFSDFSGKVNTLSVTGGTGSDSVSSSSTFESLGNVTIKTGSGSDFVDLGGKMGKLSLTTGGGSDSIDISGAQVNGAGTIKMEAGHDVLNILGGTKFFSTLAIDQGSGDDTLFVANLLPDPVVTFAGKVTVKQGSGNDTLAMDLTSGVGKIEPIFSVAGNVFDGGTGFDTNGLINANNAVSVDDGNVNFLNYDDV